MFSKSLLLGAILASASLSQALNISQAPFGAIYILNNDPRGASIIAATVSRNGTFSSPTNTSTGGKGLSGVTGPGQPNVGGLFGSNSVVVEDDVSMTTLLSRDVV